MSLIFTFAELDKLYEAANDIEYEWSFYGKVRFFNYRVGYEDIINIEPKDTLKTTAPTEEKALSNIKFQIRRKYGLHKRAKLEPFDYTLTNETELMTPIKSKEKRTCSRCGRQLTDGGTCPECTDGVSVRYLDDL